jgi:CubicO group peptidase (beta-lactamase class C family)
MRCVWLLFILIVSCGQSKVHVDANYSLKNKIESIIEEGHFNGVIKLVKADKIVYENCVGYSNFKDKCNLMMSDQFVIGSISKQITAVLVLQFFENDKLNLNDTIGKYLKNVNKNWKNRITIHQLLTHTHGVKSLSQELSFEPGSQFEYSQLGFHLLAKILENISGQTFQELTSELFLKYNLNHTIHPNSFSSNLVMGYENINGYLTEMTNSTENFAAAGSLISNSKDLTHWNELLHGGKLLKIETLKLMKTRYATRIHPIYGEVEYGYGLLFKTNENDIQIGALGYAPGFVSSCYYFPQSNYNLVILENVAQDIPDFKKCFRTQIQVLELVKKME